jgi:hypothetical protein
MTTINTEIRRFPAQFQYSMIALLLMNVYPSAAVAQDGHSHTQTLQQYEMTSEQKSNAGALLKIVRESSDSRMCRSLRRRGMLCNSAV